MKTVSLADLIDELFPQRLVEMPAHVRKTYPVVLPLCSVIRGRPPRHPGFDLVRDLGMADIEAVLYGGKLTRSGGLCFMFPERWMSVHEQQRFVACLCRHPQAPAMGTVLIGTSSPLVVGEFFKEQIRIIRWDDDTEYEHG